MLMVDTHNTQRKGIVFKVGIAILGLAGILWASPLYVPFSPLDTSSKVLTITLCIVAAELLFWVGAYMVGKEYIQKFKRRLSLKNWKNSTTVDKAE